MRDQITRIKITKKKPCFIENRRSCNEILAIYADCPFRFNRILSADESVAFPGCSPVRPMVRISSIGQAIFQDIKKFAPVPFMCGRNRLSNTDKKGQSQIFREMPLPIAAFIFPRVLSKNFCFCFGKYRRPSQSMISLPSRWSISCCATRAT